MPDLGAPDYSVARFAIERGLAAIYLIAFVVAAEQFPELSGERGLEPATHVLRLTSFLRTPSIFHWRYSDRLLVGVAVVGAVVSASLLLGIPEAAPLPLTTAAWFVLWAMYGSIVNVGGGVFGFRWGEAPPRGGVLGGFLR